jgi:hypothetical protein
VHSSTEVDWVGGVINEFVVKSLGGMMSRFSIRVSALGPPKSNVKSTHYDKYVYFGRRMVRME